MTSWGICLRAGTCCSLADSWLAFCFPDFLLRVVSILGKIFFRSDELPLLGRTWRFEKAGLDVPKSWWNVGRTSRDSLKFRELKLSYESLRGGKVPIKIFHESHFLDAYEREHPSCTCIFGSWYQNCFVGNVNIYTPSAKRNIRYINVFNRPSWTLVEQIWQVFSNNSTLQIFSWKAVTRWWLMKHFSGFCIVLDRCIRQVSTTCMSRINTLHIAEYFDTISANISTILLSLSDLCWTMPTVSSLLVPTKKRWNASAWNWIRRSTHLWKELNHGNCWVLQFWSDKKTGGGGYFLLWNGQLKLQKIFGLTNMESHLHDKAIMPRSGESRSSVAGYSPQKKLGSGESREK